MLLFLNFLYLIHILMNYCIYNFRCRGISSSSLEKAWFFFLSSLYMASQAIVLSYYKLFAINLLLSKSSIYSNIVGLLLIPAVPHLRLVSSPQWNRGLKWRKGVWDLECLQTAFTYEAFLRANSTCIGEYSQALDMFPFNLQFQCIQFCLWMAHYSLPVSPHQLLPLFLRHKEWVKDPS